MLYTCHVQFIAILSYYVREKVAYMTGKGGKGKGGRDGGVVKEIMRGTSVG